MTRIADVLRDFLEDDSGSELAEYALALALFSMVAVGSLTLLAVAAESRQGDLQTHLQTSGQNKP